MALFKNSTKFLVDTNNNIKKVVEAKKPDEVIEVLNNVSLAEAMYILPMTKIYDNEFTKTVQLMTGEFSLAVLASYDDDFLVYKYDEERDGWLQDSRFGMYGRVDYEYLHEISYACDRLVGGCDAHIGGLKVMKETLESFHEWAAQISEVVGFERALEMFTWAVELSGVKVEKADKTGRNTLGPVWIGTAAGSMLVWTSSHKLVR